MASVLKTIAAYNARRRTRSRRDLSSLAALIAAPASLGSAAQGQDGSATLALPANSRLAVSLDAVTEPGDIVLRVRARPLGIGGGPSGLVMELGYAERGAELTIARGAACPAGTARLYTLDQWHRAYEIATCTFSA